MTAGARPSQGDLVRRLAEAEGTIEALLSGQIDAVVDTTSHTPVLLAKAQEALRASEEQYRQIVETTSDGIIKIDNLARLVFVNRRFAEMLGYEPRELLGNSVYDYVDAAGKVTVRESLQRRRPGAKDVVDSTMRRKNGSAISVNIAGSALVDGEGHPTGYLAIVRDFTEHKKLQSQLMISDRMASVGTLAAGVAHEINNPLAAVIGNLECMSDSLAGMVGGESPAWLLDEMKGPLDDAREAAQRVRFIVRDLKIFARSPNEELKGPVDVVAIMESSLRMAWNEIRHRAQLVKNYGPVPGVDANEARLGQVFLNLIVNAAQSIQVGRAEHNEIRVTTRQDGEQVVIEVADTGAGIAPEIIDRIFDAFFTTKAVGVGTGLGLAICHRIVTDMGGQLTVASEVGKGSTFRVSLPVAPDDQEYPAPAPVEEPAVAGRRGRILIVDDDQMVLRGVQRTLSKEHDVIALESAQAALARCAGGERFDLILCDLMMPEMTGMDFHRELMLIDSKLANRTIFMTGGAFTPQAARFLSDTPKEHVEKPFHPANLRAIVQRFLATG